MSECMASLFVIYAQKIETGIVDIVQNDMMLL